MIEIEKFVVGPLETNCYLVYDTASKSGFLIDPGSFDKRISDAIREKGIRVKNIINTHGHVDHTAGNKGFGYPVLIHRLEGAFLRNPVKNLSFFSGIASLSPAASGILEDGDIIEEGGVRFEVIHTPGHTPGSISLRLGNRIFTGDTLFCEGVGRTDIPYANERDLLDSVKRRLMTASDDTEILPGHGPGSTIGHERRNNPFL